MKAHELLADRAKWTAGSYARNANGTRCAYDDPEACQWCAVGALAHCYPVIRDYEKAKARWIGVLKHKYGDMDLDEVNDQVGYDAVIAVLREANV